MCINLQGLELCNFLQYRFRTHLVGMWSEDCGNIIHYYSAQEFKGKSGELVYLGFNKYSDLEK